MSLLNRTERDIIDGFYDANVGRILPITCCKCGEWRVGKRFCECGRIEIDIILNEDGYPVIVDAMWRG